MKSSIRPTTLLLTLVMVSVCTGLSAQAPVVSKSPGERELAKNSRTGQFTFVFFYRVKDRSTQSAYEMLKPVAQKHKAGVVPVRIGDAAERDLVRRFDATRMPMPAVAAIAPNGAVTGVFARRVTAAQIEGAIVSRGYAACIKALQSRQIVLLCVQPERGAYVPQGARDFQAHKSFRNRTRVINLRAADPAEAKFLGRLKVRTDMANPTVVFMAPPGVMLGKYDHRVSARTLTTKLIEAGKCCDDPKCKHHHPR